MKTKTKMILLVISSILSLVWIYLSYYGYIRYMSIKYRSTEHFVKKYEEMPLTKGDKIVLYLVYSDKKKAEIAIASLLDQTIKCHSITLLIPEGTPKSGMSFTFQEFNKIYVSILLHKM